MLTKHQTLGEKGEKLVAKHCSCPKCKREGSLTQLRQNFKCADVICDFCGYLAQVKAQTSTDVSHPPGKVLGAAWSVQQERMEAGIYFPVFFIQIDQQDNFSIFYLSADLQTPEIFVVRKPLSSTAKRAGWQGFSYDLSRIQNRLIKLH